MSLTFPDLEEQWAGAFKEGTSDKVWAAGYTASGIYIVVFGKRGSTLQGGKPNQMGSLEAAKAKFLKDRDEKINKKGYNYCGFDQPNSMIPAFGTPRIPNPLGGDGVAALSGSTPDSAVPKRTTVYRTAHVTPMDWDEMRAKVQAGNWLWAEKVNGVRCLVSWKDGVLKSYNRKGQENLSPPVGASALRALPVDCLLDGEQMDSDRAGQYVVFDILELDGQDLRPKPFETRLNILRSLFIQHGLTDEAQIGPTLNLPLNAPGLALLAPTNQHLDAAAAMIKSRRGEGIVVREKSGTYTPGDTSVIRKFKFLGEIDCEVIDFKPGSGGGSLQLGVTRLSDGEIIPIGFCRSGLNETTINTLREQHRAGERPVVSVRYLTARTTGLALVEATIDRIRTDKSASECTTEQFGSDKTPHIESAKPHTKGRTL